MANFNDKILYLKNLLPEDGVGEVLERLKLMLIQNKHRVNDIIQMETRLSKLNNDSRFQFITRDVFNSQYALLTKDVIDYLDELKPEDLEVPTQPTSRKKNSGHLLRRIPDQMQLHKRTKCVIRLAHLREELLENYEMTADTIIKSVRVAEVMEVDLQDRNEVKAFEITTPNTKDQFLDEGYYTEWIFNVKPIKEGKHELTLVVSVLEEIRGKERRRDVVMEEVVTIVTEEVIADEVYKSTGYQVRSTKSITPQPFRGFRNIQRYAAALVLLIIGTLGIWAFSTESGQFQMAKWQNTKSGFEDFIRKNETPNTSKYVADAKKQLEKKTYEEALLAADNGNIDELLAFVEKYPESQHASDAVDKLIGIEYDLIAEAKSTRSTEPLVDFIKRYEHIETPKNKEIQAKARLKYKKITNQEITPEIIKRSPAKPLQIKGFIKNNSLNDFRLIDSSLINNDIKNKPSTNIKTVPADKIIIQEKTRTKQPIITNKIQTDKLILRYQADKFAHQLVRVQGGTFQMGSTKGKSNERPVHAVKLKSFSISKYEITQQQWRDIMEKDNDNYHKNCDNCPVDNVSWKDANNFIKTLNKKTGRNYRLPTEAEWEYAAKGGQKSKKFTFAGSNNITDVAWYSKNSNRKTYKVGSKRPNELGLYDMSGNVYEWCSDWYDKNYYKNSPTSNPQNTNSSNRYHVLRGGSWFNYSKYCRTTSRRTNTDDNEYTMNGFRLVHD